MNLSVRGRVDGGFALEANKWFGKWFADGEMGYALQGKSTVVNVKDYLYYYGGGGYQLLGRLRLMFLLKGSTPTVEGAGSLLEARFKVKYQITKETGLDAYLSKGMTTASPDFGTGLTLFYFF